MNQRILIIDDDLELCQLLDEYLSREGFSIDSVNHGEEGAEQAVAQEFVLVILDVMLPGLNGFDVLRRIREKSKVPVLMLTARGDDVDRIVGLEMGADDYLPKPFNPRELLARIRAIQRRVETAEQNHQVDQQAKVLAVGDIRLDSGAREVIRDEKRLDLTGVEFSLLEALLQKAGEVIDRETLVRTVLGRRLSPYDRSIDVHISSLRKKLRHEGDPAERIKTVRGIGYMYATPTQSAEKTNG
ncbi:MAG: DNA-binding response regulator [Desulfuromonas sp.]|nr:MAG: DNA-binding response regulator [Desulfuromonas sp.]